MGDSNTSHSAQNEENEEQYDQFEDDMLSKQQEDDDYGGTANTETVINKRRYIQKATNNVEENSKLNNSLGHQLQSPGNNHYNGGLTNSKLSYGVNVPVMAV